MIFYHLKQICDFLVLYPSISEMQRGAFEWPEELGRERNTNLHFNIIVYVGLVFFPTKKPNYLGLCCRLISCFPSFHFSGESRLLLAIRLVLQQGNATVSTAQTKLSTSTSARKTRQRKKIHSHQPICSFGRT